MSMEEGALRLELFVTDVEQSATFYERVLGFAREHQSPGYVAMRRGTAIIGIGAAGDLPAGHPLKPDSKERKGLGVEVVLEVGDVDAAHAAVEASGHPILSPLKERPWGLRDFRIVDRDGYYLRITPK